MEDYKAANIKKYIVSHDRIKFLTHPSKIIGIESLRRRCRYLVSSNEWILDIGGGSGMWTQILKEEGISIRTYALDMSLSMLKERPHIDICVCGDMENLPFKDESFDRTFFFASLHHVKNTRIALDEAKRVVRPNGYVVISEPVSLRLLIKGKKIEPVSEHEFCFSVFYLFRLIRQIGLRVVYRHHRGFFWRLLPTKSNLRLNRIADRLDDILSKIPLLRVIRVLGSTVTIVARKY